MKWLKKRFQCLALKKDKYLFIYYRDLLILIFAAASVILILPSVKTPDLDSLPFLYSNIASIDGFLMSDSRLIRGGSAIYSIKVRKVFSKDGMSADIDGVVRILARGEGMLKGSLVSASFKTFPDIDQLKNNSGTGAAMIRSSGISKKGQSCKIILRQSVLDYVLNKISMIETQNGFISALLTGNRDRLDERTALNIKKSGCSHILALSGMHLGIIAAFIFFVLKPLAGTNKSIIAANIFSLFFLFMAGTSASLLRSFIFFVLVSISKLFSRKTDLRKLIVLCFILTAFISPDDSSELSFQYSFIAAAGIIFSAEILYKKLAGVLPAFAAAPAACSLAAQLPAYILSGLVFSEIYPSGIAASLILTPLIAVLMWSAVPALLLVIITGRTFRFINLVLDIQSDIIGFTASFFAEIPLIRVNSCFLALLFVLNIFIIISALYPGKNKIFFKRYR